MIANLHIALSITNEKRIFGNQHIINYLKIHIICLKICNSETFSFDFLKKRQASKEITQIISRNKKPDPHLKKNSEVCLPINAITVVLLNFM